MRNSWKVAKWEIKRNLKSKSFLISLAITPIIFLLFAIVPSFFSSDDEPTQVYILDELNVYGQIEQIIENSDLDWELQTTNLSEEEMTQAANENEQSAYVAITQEGLSAGEIPVYLHEDVGNEFFYEVSILENTLRQLQLQQLDLTEEQLEVIGKGISFTPVVAEQGPTAEEGSGAGDETTSGDPLKRIIPSVAAGIILFSIVMTGMMIFTSASEEKKQKVAEIVLSSITPTDLMQGKIIGYFILGITQVVVWIAFLLPVAIWKFEFPLFDYLLVPEFALLLLISLAGYLLFAAIFVGIGATVEDVSSTSNFQGIVMMLPFLPLMFIGPIISDPNGIIAKVMTYVPVTSPGVILIRVALLDEWPWVEILISIAILLVSIWLAMKAAGKIFKIGILMYGKNATPKEIWKWLWT